MIPKECKRLAEVDFPIAVVSKHAAREKSIRHGHPSTLHLWWARRPLAACRSMLMALLLPDPCDPHCPAEFKKKARALLLNIRGSVDGADLELRRAILNFIGDSASWDLSSDATYVEVANGLVKAAHPEEPPLVVDPFAGGGSIPLEALRLGCDAFASDLNPVACLINKVLLEDIPRHGPELAEELRRAGAEIKKAAEKELVELYPPDPDGAIPIAYLWARTVLCESPNCGAEVPLVRSFWLSKKASRTRALRFEVIRANGERPRVVFHVFEPRNEREVPNGTVSRARAVCLCCGAVLLPERVRAQLHAQRGGADAVLDESGNRIGGARLLTVVTVDASRLGRVYRIPDARDYAAVAVAQRCLSELPQDAIPNEEIPVTERRRISVPIYGIDRWGDLFNSRQKTMLFKLARIASRERYRKVQDLLGIAVDRVADRGTSVCRWDSSPTSEVVKNTFSRQALGMVWDYAEVNPLSDSTGNVGSVIDLIVHVIEQCPTIRTPGQVAMADAAHSDLPDASCSIWFTDPPYYDSVPYGHLADFFYVWLRRCVSSAVRRWFRNPIIDKDAECVVDRPHVLSKSTKTSVYYEDKLGSAMREGRRVLNEEGIGAVVFAHKTTEGWEALLSAMFSAGWTITASWPVNTEMRTRLTARDTASLATSVHLVCRPRRDDAPIGDWGGVLHELPGRVGNWMERLQGEGVRGADLVFACIGPALEIYSRYSKVVDPQEREIPLGGNPLAQEPHERGYLAYVWEAVGRTALQQVLGTAEAKARNGGAGALEEDARLTALFLWTIQATPTGNGNGNGDRSQADDDEDSGESEPDEEAAPKRRLKGFSLIYDVVRRFAQPLGIHLDDWEKRVVETDKGVVRLIPVLDRAEQLFGEAGASLTADHIEAEAKRSPQTTFDFMAAESAVPQIKGRGKRRQPAADVSDESLRSHRGATTLDRVHAAMLLQSSGRAHALRALLKSEIERGPDFLRLANALSALYPPGSDEKRLVDAMLLAVPR